MSALSPVSWRLPARCLVVLGIAAGCGTSTPAPAPVATGAAITQVLTFQAFDAVGLLPHLTPVATMAGTCASGSVVHAGRAGAWRCTGDGPGADDRFDPCFANEASTLLACVANPWATDVTIIRPLASLGRAGSNRNDPGAPPWFVELEDEHDAAGPPGQRTGAPTATRSPAPT